MYLFHFVFFFKQKTAYEMRISDWSSDVCSSDLQGTHRQAFGESIQTGAGDRWRVARMDSRRNTRATANCRDLDGSRKQTPVPRNCSICTGCSGLFAETCSNSPGQIVC